MTELSPGTSPPPVRIPIRRLAMGGECSPGSGQHHATGAARPAAPRYGGAMSLRRPALDPAEVAPRSRSGYPEPFRSRVLPREKRALGEALGLTALGINLT